MHVANVNTKFECECEACACKPDQDNAGHKTVLDEVVVPAQIAGTIPTAAALDQQLPGVVDGEENSGKPAQDSAAATGYPPNIHVKLQQLMDEGKLPMTTAEQRQRNLPTKGTTYKTPPMFTEALHLGYVSPNLPNPYGFYWAKEPANVWILKPRLGG